MSPTEQSANRDREGRMRVVAALLRQGHTGRGVSEMLRVTDAGGSLYDAMDALRRGDEERAEEPEQRSGPEPLSSLRLRATLDGECPVCHSPDLIAAGDKLQSAASRMAEWIGTQGGSVPYEVLQATFEARTSVDAWTDARSKRP